MTGEANAADGLHHAARTVETLDASQIDCLLEVAGVCGVDEIMQAFWKSTDALLAALHVAVENRDPVEAGRIAHALKGSSANVGASLLSSVARDAEMAAKCGDFSTARAACAATHSAYEATRRAIAERIAAFQQR
jgi:HPt (histidine-containing phosphotransfer) domain-containing protein